jgi:L-alanine-DL-glutamate epimerase-like enolase superfamily enzyme
MLNLELIPVTLHLRSTFRISREARNKNDNIIAAVSDGKYTGLGETSSHRYYGKTIAGISHNINNCSTYLNKVTEFHPEEIWQDLLDLTNGDRFALCALDCALWDLWAQRQGKPLYTCLGLSTENNVASDVTISLGSIDEMLNKLNEYPDWPIYKIKLGSSEDISIIQAIRAKTDSVLRVDANCAWDAEEGLVKASILADSKVEFIEQPLKADDWEGMEMMHASSSLPLIADESCIIEEDVERCSDFFNGINIKLMKCGGLTPALRMISLARRLDLMVMVGCMTESSVGMSAIAHILPLLDAVDMDGGVLISNDPAEGVKVEKGICSYTELPGLGVKLNRYPA